MQFAHMFLQVEVPAESFAAGGAGKGFLVVVGVHVEGQVVDLMKCLVTDIALELLLPAVSKLVVLVITFLVEALATKFTDERLVSCVDPRVRVQRGTPIESFAALVALVWLLLCVNDLVAAQRTSLAKPLSADFADKRPGPGVYRHVSC